VVSAGHRCDVIAPPQAIIVWGDKSKIEVILNDLIESVISSAGERVTIEIREEASGVMVSIGNERVYIPPS
jgi:signal transduction histidine kinase